MQTLIALSTLCRSEMAMGYKAAHQLHDDDNDDDDDKPIGGGAGGRGGSCPPTCRQGGKRYQMPPHFAYLVKFFSF